jgi:hypothetical protein
MRRDRPAGKLTLVRLERLRAFLHYVRIGRWPVAWAILRGERQRGGTRSG